MGLHLISKSTQVCYSKEEERFQDFCPNRLNDKGEMKDLKGRTEAVEAKLRKDYEKKYGLCKVFAGGTVLMLPLSHQDVEAGNVWTKNQGTVKLSKGNGKRGREALAGFSGWVQGLLWYLCCYFGFASLSQWHLSRGSTASNYSVVIRPWGVDSC